MKHLPPFRFTPVFRQTVWGGKRIAALKQLPEPTLLGESWELSGLPGSETVVAEPLADAGLTPGELAKKYGAALMGDNYDADAPFPLLVKLIDTASDLSIQVHPDDVWARNHNLPGGKSEMWYVVHAKAGARVLAGLQQPLDAAAYDAAVGATFEHLLRRYTSHAGDAFSIPAGRVHSLGAGNLVVEVQQTSDVTFRVYDFGRNLPSRPLHTAQARTAINFSDTADARLPLSGEGQLCRTPHFSVSLHRFRRNRTLSFDGRTFHIVVATQGCVEIIAPSCRLELRCGHTLLLPACLRRVRVHCKTPAAALLDITP